jgi:hypothetical protein
MKRNLRARDQASGGEWGAQAGWLMFHAQRHLHSPADMCAAFRAVLLAPCSFSGRSASCKTLQDLARHRPCSLRSHWVTDDHLEQAARSFEPIAVGSFFRFGLRRHGGGSSATWAPDVRAPPAGRTDAERASFGPCVGHVMKTLEECTGCERICAAINLSSPPCPLPLRLSRLVSRTAGVDRHDSVRREFPAPPWSSHPPPHP